MDDCSYTYTRYLLEDLRISHVGVSSSSSFLSMLLNIGVCTHTQGISRDYSFSLHPFTDNQSAALSI